MTQYTDSASLNGLTFSSNYFYNATGISSGSQNINGQIGYDGSVTAADQAGIEGQISSSGNGYFTVTSSSGASAQYQVLGSTADGNNLVFENAQAQGSNTGPYYILSGSGGAPDTGVLAYSSTNSYQAPTCFVAGTRIATTRGEIAVEDVHVGDTCLTASGAMRRVIWIGSTRIHVAARARADEVNPIAIAAEALADNVPQRELRVSPGHKLLLGGKLFTAASLVNGASIVQKAVDVVDYHHIELDAPDALVAEGAAAESYVDVGNRWAFSGAIGHPSAPAILDADPRVETFAPVVLDGPELVAARRKLVERALLIGWQRIVDRDIQLVVGDRAIAPTARVGDHAWFVLPEPSTTVTIVSRSAICSEIKPDELDDRRLGVQIVGIIVDGRSLQLGHPAFADGFHGCEVTDEDEHFRWTDGSAQLHLRRPASVIEVRIGRGAELITPVDVELSEHRQALA